MLTNRQFTKHKFCYLKLEGDNMQGINSELLQAIKDEVTAKTDRDTARRLVKVRRPITRSQIEDIQELTRLEDDWMNS